MAGILLKDKLILRLVHRFHQSLLPQCRYLPRRGRQAPLYEDEEIIDSFPLKQISEPRNPDTRIEFEQLDQFPSDIVKNNEFRQQQRHAFRPKVDPHETSILLFPGQGSQFVGMGKKLLQYPNVKELYKLSSDILGYNLLELCLSGPKEKLSKTEFCQPAIFVTSLAAVEKLKDDFPMAIDNCIATAGFSVGEYAALVFSGMLDFEDALKIVKVRAKEMQRASEEIPGAMMSVICSADTKLGYACLVATKYCSEKLNMDKPVCRIANYLGPNCKVVSGCIEALNFIKANMKQFGIIRIKDLPVSGAFHTELMDNVKQPLRDILKYTRFHKPLISVHNNTTAKRANQKNLMTNLIQQVCRPVKWEQTMHVLYTRQQGQSFPSTYELGPGKHLGTILRTINSKAMDSYTAVDV